MRQANEKIMPRARKAGLVVKGLDDKFWFTTWSGTRLTVLNEFQRRFHLEKC